MPQDRLIINKNFKDEIWAEDVRVPREFKCPICETPVKHVGEISVQDHFCFVCRRLRASIKVEVHADGD